MPSVKNPNKPSKNRLAARAAKTRKQRRKLAAAGRTTRVAQSDRAHGARPGLLPTSGPRAPLSAKKQKKLDQRLRLALRRKMAEAGEVEMKGECRFFFLCSYTLLAGMLMTYLRCCRAKGKGRERRHGREEGDGYRVKTTVGKASLKSPAQPHGGPIWMGIILGSRTPW